MAARYIKLKSAHILSPVPRALDQAAAYAGISVRLRAHKTMRKQGAYYNAAPAVVQHFRVDLETVVAEPNDTITNGART